MRLERYDLSNGVTSEGEKIKLNLQYSPLRGGFGGLCKLKKRAKLVRGVAVGETMFVRVWAMKGKRFDGIRGSTWDMVGEGFVLAFFALYACMQAVFWR